MSITEYLSENYEIEQEFLKGKYIAIHDRKITFPVGVHIYFDGRIYEVIRSMSGYKTPATKEFWEEYVDIALNQDELPRYSQFETYRVGDIVIYNSITYRCLSDNGYKFGDIRIPLVNSWVEKSTEQWLPIDYTLWNVVSHNGSFYTLMNLDGFDNNASPFDSDCARGRLLTMTLLTTITIWKDTSMSCTRTRCSTPEWM